MNKLIYAVLLFILTGCGDFLKQYSQDLVVAKTVGDFDELLLGSVYMPSYKAGDFNMPGSGSCAFLNILDDDINTVKGENVVDLNTYRNRVRPCWGYYAWQQEVGRPLGGNDVAPDGATWGDLYKRINLCNVILAEMSELKVKKEQEQLDKIRIEGECRFLRAQFYLVLVNLYGNAYQEETAGTTLGVPLKLTPYVEHEKDKPTQFDRATLEEVYKQIVVDLKESVRCLSESPQTRPFYRVSAGAARLLLSRVYLYMQDWENARQTAADFLETAPRLTSMLTMNDSTSVFLDEESAEIVFSQGSLTMQVVLNANPGDFCVSRDLYNLYDREADKRAIVFFADNQDSVKLHAKYKRGDHQSRVSDILMLRSAEGYLNMAEACAMLDDTEANFWLNELRRARISDYQDQTYSGSELVEQIRIERRKELCFEGHRWFDLRRYAVNSNYPFKKKICHVFNEYNEDVIMAPFRVGKGYILEEDDLAYTFAIPKNVIEFDLVGMPDNPREKRSASWLTYWGDENN